MGKSTARLFRDEHQKEIVRRFDKICYRHNRWDVWSNFITMVAIEISNAVDSGHAEHRGEMYRNIAKQYDAAEMQLFAEMFAEIVAGMEQNPDQDFLGELFMCLDLGNEHRGQFFTPYCICKMMAQINSPNLKELIAERGWISVSDPACGAGALLVAFANMCRQPDIDVNYQTSVLFVAQDIDFTVGCMCYIQLSLMGCAGYVVIDDSLLHPSTSYDEHGLLPKDTENVWYTPFFFRTEWHMRRMGAMMDYHFRQIEAQSPADAPVEMPVAAPINEPEPESVFGETKHGQLTLF